MKAFAIFEGGGAKGYAHLGALRASEDRGIDFEAVAGSSVGAIVASLVAAGYSSRELFDVDAEGKHTGVLSENPIDQLNKRDWERFTRATGYGARSSFGAAVFRRAISSRMGRSFRQTYVQWWIWLVCFFVPFLTLQHRGIVTALFKNLGVTSADGLKAFLEAALQRKLGIPANRRVKFSDLPIPLKVIAADLIDEQLILFPEDPTDSVVDAVVASASFPLFFTPSRFRDRLLVDGGILSNRPVWVFDDERQQLSESIPTIAFLLASKPLQDDEVRPNRPPSSIYSYLVKMFRTAAFGNQRLETRAVDDYIPVPLITGDIETLDIEDAFRRAVELIERGRADAKACFDTQIGPREPGLMKDALQSLSIALYEDLRALDATPGEIQCSIIMRTNEGFARVSYASYQPASDYGVKLRFDSPGPARCFQIKEPILTIVDEIPKDRRENPLYKYEHALRNPEVKTLYSVPIFQDAKAWEFEASADRPTPMAVLTIGTVGALETYFALPEVEDALATYAQILAFGLSQQADLAWIRAEIKDVEISRAPGATWLQIDNTDAFLRSDRRVRRIVPTPPALRFFDRLPREFVVCAEPVPLS